MPPAPVSPLITVVFRGTVLFVAWWALTLGESSGLAFGAVVSALVAVVSLRLFPASGFSVRPAGLMLFLGYFLSRSVVAGVDVARRLLSPALPVQPGEITLTLNLPEGSPRWLLANTLSLMPGTLSILLEGNRLTLHCLDIRDRVERDVRETERQVGRVFGLAVDDSAEAAR
ncbi:MAG: multicomponent Na+:H+ antiporter subunit E [Marinobacter excellens HL-55]|uniref:Multicomponent Na+:H+ antiporter subunit E n=1 Tax=Marinobacter excellens HL-55 TaxID=1305731 RepID=A0A0P7YFG0_9GAMM|nr:MAG: multicomponent Na+:H+ antiporter subunit E [Marinobacter excellens HL-55]